MDNVLREILRKNQYFEEINENRFIPQFLGLIVNGVVVYHVNWIDIVDAGQGTLRSLLELFRVDPHLLDQLQDKAVLYR